MARWRRFSSRLTPLVCPASADPSLLAPAPCTAGGPRCPSPVLCLYAHREWPPSSQQMPASPLAMTTRCPARIWPEAPRQRHQRLQHAHCSAPPEHRRSLVATRADPPTGLPPLRLRRRCQQPPRRCHRWRRRWQSRRRWRHAAHAAPRTSCAPPPGRPPPSSAPQWRPPCIAIVKHHQNGSGWFHITMTVTPAVEPLNQRMGAGQLIDEAAPCPACRCVRTSPQRLPTTNVRVLRRVQVWDAAPMKTLRPNGSSYRMTALYQQPHCFEAGYRRK